jgi:hypothetical protein
MSSLRSLGTHLADFLDRLRSSCRVAWMVLVDTPWILASFLTVTHLSLSTSAAISVKNVEFLFLLWVLKPLWSDAGFPFFTFFMMS